MTGYTRQSAANISDGLTIFAEDINNEFNAIQTAFNGTTGHTHDGSIGSGPKISLTTSISGILPAANGGSGGINNVSATTDPTVNDDENDNYTVGSRWINTTSDKYFVCVDNTVGAAVWQRYQLYDVDLEAIAALTSTANKLPYATGAGTWALTDFSAFGRTLVDDADASAARITLGLVIGSNVQAYNANLAAISALTFAADKGVYFSGATTAATFDLTAAGRALMDDADASAQLTTLGFSAFGKTLIDDADAATARSTLGLSLGSQAQAWDAGLDALAAFNTNGFLVQTADNTFVGRTLAGTANEISISNPAGTAGNPTFSLSAALIFTGKTITGGTYAAGSFSGTWTSGPVTTSSLTATGGSTSNVAHNGSLGATTRSTVQATTGDFNSTLNVTGQITGASNIVSTGGNIQATAGSLVTGSRVVGPVSAGTMVIRPNGIGSATGQMTVDTSGNLTAAGDITASSDKRLKKNIKSLHDVSEAIDDIQPVHFERIETGEKSIGFIAQDVQKHFPELVHENEDGMLSLSYANLTAILWEEIKCLRKRVQELEKK
jgi:hypothetical protein